MKNLYLLKNPKITRKKNICLILFFDIIHGLSYETIVGCATHPKNENVSYWNNMSLCQETFAHMFEAQFDELKYNRMKEFFPSALKEFETMLEDYC